MTHTRTITTVTGATRTVPVRRHGGLRKLCGCPVRQWPKCAHPWHFNFKCNGKAHRLSLDKHVGHRLVTKAEAQAAADTVRAAIRAGTFRATTTPTPPPATPDGLTVTAFGTIFLDKCPKGGRGKGRGQPRGKNDRAKLRQLATLPTASGQPWGETPIGAIVEADVEAALAALRARGRAASTHNKYLQLIASMSKWGRKKGYLTRPWIEPDSEDVTRDDEKREQRSRRLRPDVIDKDGRLVEAGEERRLLAVAPPRLQRLIIGALETGARLGELLSLTWGDLDGDWLTIRAAVAKDGKARAVPISARLRPVLNMARAELEANLPATRDPAVRAEAIRAAHVFGDRVGRKVTTPRKAWVTAVLKAHGIEPQWVQGKGRLASASLAAYQRINIRFHDLRHEAGSRWLERGVPLHHVRDTLGHADLSTTNRYLNADRHDRLQSMRRAEAARCKAVAISPPMERPLPCSDGQPEAPQPLLH